jgi:hypothetical protein
MGIVLTTSEVDLAELEAAGLAPADWHAILPRRRQEHWLVAHGPITLETRVPWGPVRDGDYIYVPLVPYRTHADLTPAIQYALTLGLRAGLDVQLLPGRDLKRIHLVTPQRVTDLGPSEGIAAVRFVLGLAVQLT